MPARSAGAHGQIRATVAFASDFHGAFRSGESRRFEGGTAAARPRASALRRVSRISLGSRYLLFAGLGLGLALGCGGGSGGNDGAAGTVSIERSGGASFDAVAGASASAGSGDRDTGGASGHSGNGGASGRGGNGAASGQGGDGGAGGAIAGLAGGGEVVATCGERAVAEDSSGALALPECNLEGSWYSYADAAGTEISEPTVEGAVPYRSGTGMCLAGHVIRDATYAAWGGGIGISTRGLEVGSTHWGASAADVIGVEVTVSGTVGLADLQLLAEDEDGRPPEESPPFVFLRGPGTHRVLFSEFEVPQGWAPNAGEHLDPSQLRYLSVHVAGGQVEGDFDYCVTNVALIAADVIDDLEDGDDQVLAAGSRHGTWYTYSDGTGTLITEQSTINSDTGFEGGRAARAQGSGFTDWGAGIGFIFNWDSAQGIPSVYDASAYAGVRLRVKGNSATGTLRVLPVTQAVATPDNGGTCPSNCIDPHFWVVPLSQDYREYLLPFSHLFQNGEAPASFDPSRMLALDFQAPGGSAFDVSVDDVAFYRSAAPRPNPDPGIQIALSPREEQPLLAARTHGLAAFPDQAVLQLDLGSQQRFLLSAWPLDGSDYPSAATAGQDGHQPTFALDAAGITNLADATVREVLSPGTGTSFDNGYAGLSALYRHSDGRLYGFYHAEDWLTEAGERTPTIPGTDVVPGFYASVAAAVSDDDGLTWNKLGQVLTSEQAKDWTNPISYDQGVCGPGAVVDPNGRFLLLYYTDNSRQDGQSVQLSVARADLRDGPPGPSSLQKYYLGSFSEPGLAGKGSPLPGRDAYLVNPVHSYGHPIWSQYLKRYVMVLNVGTWDTSADDLDPTRSGIYLMFSEDGLYWSSPRQLVADYIYFQPGRSLSYMATLLFDDESGRDGWLLYGHSDFWNDPDTHELVGHRISFTIP